MATKMTANGVSTTIAPGQEQYEKSRYCGRVSIQYDYRTSDGELFSCCAPTLKACRAKRDKWMQERG